MVLDLPASGRGTPVALDPRVPEHKAAGMVRTCPLPAHKGRIREAQER